jgi:hypothetical protein
MKITLDDVMRIAGNTDSEKQTARGFCDEVTAEAEKRLALLRDLADGKVILDAEQLRIARDAVAGLRHLYSMIRELAGLHRNGQLRAPFASLNDKVTRMKEQGETIFTKMDGLYLGRGQ